MVNGSHTYCVSTSVVGRRGREESLAALAAAGFAEIEIGGDPGKLEDWIADPPAMRRRLADYGLRARVLHLATEAWDIAHPDDAARRGVVDLALRGLRDAAGVGAEIVICHPNGPSGNYAAYTPADLAASLARTRESLEILAPEAARLGLRLALENLPLRHTARPGGAMAEILALVAGLGGHVGVCQGVGHSNANGVDPAADAREAGGRLYAIHIQDNDGLGEDQHLVPGEGTIDWRAYLAALDEIGYAGPRTFEIRAADDLPGALAALQGLVAEWNGR